MAVNGRERDEWLRNGSGYRRARFVSRFNAWRIGGGVTGQAKVRAPPDKR